MPQANEMSWMAVYFLGSGVLMSILVYISFLSTTNFVNPEMKVESNIFAL